MNDLDNQKFRELIREGKLEIPSPDFTGKLMRRVGEKPKLVPASYFQYDLIWICAILLLVLLALYIILDYSKIYMVQEFHFDVNLMERFRTNIPLAIALLISVSFLLLFDNYYERKKMNKAFN
jgi:hypothetical protein